MNASHPFGPVRRGTTGFTLVELVLVMGILVIVLTATYGLIIDCLDAERTIDKLTLPEKVGEGILSLFRSDVAGTVWRHLGTRVFFVEDNGAQRDARDAIRLLSTIEPTPREEASDGTTVEVSELRTITGICYFVKPNQGIDGLPTLTLYRKEIVDFVPDNPLGGPGQNYEVYDKVAYLSIECYDSYNSLWVPGWDSETMIQEEQLDLEASQQAAAGIAKVEKRQDSKRGTAAKGMETKNALTQNAPGLDPGLAAGEAEPLPPAAVPSAVRIEVGIYAGQGNRIERDTQGNPILKIYATIVPILTSQRVRIELDDMQSELAGGGATGDDGTVQGVQTGDPTNGSPSPGGSTRGSPRGQSSSPRPGTPGVRMPVPGGSVKAR